MKWFRNEHLSSCGEICPFHCLTFFLSHSSFIPTALILVYFTFDTNNKYMLPKLFIAFAFVFIWQLTIGQPVSFTNRSDLLNSVSGFVGYSDCAVDMNGDRLDDVVRIGNKGIYIDYQKLNGSFS